MVDGYWRNPYSSNNSFLNECTAFLPTGYLLHSFESSARRHFRTIFRFFVLISSLSWAWLFDVQFSLHLHVFLLLKHNNKHQVRASREGSRRVAWMRIVSPHFCQSLLASVINIARYYKIYIRNALYSYGNTLDVLVDWEQRNQKREWRDGSKKCWFWWTDITPPAWLEHG